MILKLALSRSQSPVLYGANFLMPIFNVYFFNTFSGISEKVVVGFKKMKFGKQI